MYGQHHVLSVKQVAIVYQEVPLVVYAPQALKAVDIHALYALMESLKISLLQTVVQNAHEILMLVHQV
jgi:hypothetical protein